MAVDIHKLIAAINPDVYCSKEYDESERKPLDKIVKDIVKKSGYLKAAEKAKPIDPDYLDIINTRVSKNAFALTGIKNPIQKHKLIYDDFSQNLEPVYFWLLDYLNYEYEKTDKLLDNFVSSAGSGFFSEMGQRATKMQEEAMKIFGVANTVLRSILNIVYDLKEFKIRLAQYDDYNNKKEKDKSRAALLSLKQIWLDKVDINRGNSSIKALAVSGANQPNFVTLIHAFMAAESLEKIKEYDLNDSVIRILEQRFPEFQLWIKESENELRKRFEIEKNYLRSQVNSLKLYSRWIKPYLHASKDLEARGKATSALVTNFNTVLFELAVMAEGKYDPRGDIALGDLPEAFKKIKTRKYSPILVVELNFRSSPERADQRGGYGFRGRVELTFTSYGLNEDEIKILKQEIEKDDVGAMLEYIEGATTKSLEQIQADIDDLLDEKKPEEKPSSDDDNPFTALFSFFKSEKKKDKEKDMSKGIPKDTYEEKVMRSQAILESRFKCRKTYEAYKKEHNLPSMPPTQF